MEGALSRVIRQLREVLMSQDTASFGLRPQQLADRCNVSLCTVHRWIRSGHLRSVRIGGVRLVPLHVLREAGLLQTEEAA